MLHEIISIISDCFWTVAPPLGMLGAALLIAHIIRLCQLCAAKRRRAAKRRKCREEWLRWETEQEAAKKAKKAAQKYF